MPPSTLVLKLDRIFCGEWNQYASAGELPPLLTGRVPGVPVVPRVAAWQDPGTGLRVTGRLDACVRVDGEGHVPVDHKGRGYAPKGVHEAYQLQLDVYELLLDRNGYPTAGHGLLVNYIVEPGALEIGLPLAVEVQRVETDIQRALSWVARAAQVLAMTAPPEPARDCPFCTWVADTQSAA